MARSSLELVGVARSWSEWYSSILFS